jgi:hypothetical protein
MEFTRKKKRGVSQKVCRLWFSPEGYRITWRKEAWGVKIQPGFHACVRTIVPGNFEGGRTLVWDFVNPKKHLYRSLKVAMADCKHHKRLWSKAAQCPGIRSIRELFGGEEPCGIPKGIYNKLDRRVVEILMDTTPRRQDIDDDEPEAPAVEAMPFPEDTEPKKRQKRRTKKVESEKSETGEGKRKQRSDKGKPRGPHKSKSETPETLTLPATEMTGAVPRKRRQRNDKGKPRGPRKAFEAPSEAPLSEALSEIPTDMNTDTTKKRRTRSDKGKKRGPRTKHEANNE